VDGMDVFAVRDTAADAVATARAGGGPVFVEALTYRFVGHSRSDPGAYRKPGELDEWKRRDPLIVGARTLRERYEIGADVIEETDAAVDAEMEAIADQALAAPFPEPGTPAREFAP
jgi:TPP-dependent pyruvate/acetoin dehydrogenase alpha subunit